MMDFYSVTMRYKQRRLHLIIIATIVATYTIFSVKYLQRSRPPDESPRGDPVHAERLRQLNADYDRYGDKNQTGIDLGPNISLDHYLNALNLARRDAFSFDDDGKGDIPPIVHDRLRRAQAMLMPDQSDPIFDHDIPKKIGTTNSNPSSMPREFDGWRRLNPGWNIAIFDHQAMDDWVEERLSIKTGQSQRQLKILTAYKLLPRQILKIDLFRYLLIMSEGGLYTDSDTASIRSIADWGNMNGNVSILHLWTDPKLQRLLPHRNTPPRLIVAIEDERDGPTAVRLELAQWTFAAVPGHPVLIDLIQHVAKVSHDIARSRKDGIDEFWMSDEFVMEWTGPKIFTEAVYRYLRVQWGFNFRRLKNVNHPVRVGDVLILPPRSFQADAAELRDGDPKYSYVWHGYSGFKTWKTHI